MSDLSGLSICFIAGTLGQGGAERQLFYALKTLRQLSARVTLLSLTRDEFWEGRIRACGIPVKWMGRRKSRLARALQIVSELQADPPDLIQSQHFYTNLYAVAAARASGRREIGALRSDTFSEALPHALTGALSLRAPRKIVANSRMAISNAISLGVPADRLHFLPTVVDSEMFRPAPKASDGVVKLLAVGRLSSEKRIDRFISVIAAIKRQSAVRVKGIVVGDGPLRESLRRLSSGIGLDYGAIEFKGAVTEMSEVYREADILVLTSEFEGTPNVILEAMASGLPVVSVGVGGVPEIVEDQVTGFLVEPYDELKMAGAITRLIREPGLRYEFGCAARRFIELNRALNHLPQMLKDFYQAVLI
jgi:glycosyltransferase involved in cell wall biosynthesis